MPSGVHPGKAVHRERLKAVDQLRDCTDAQLEEVARLADRMQVGEGEVLIQEGRLGRELFVILSGTGGGDPGRPGRQPPRPRATTSASWPRSRPHRGAPP